MHHRARLTRVATILGAGALLAALVAPGAAPVLAGGGGGGSSASTALRLACSAGSGLPTDQCVEVILDAPAGVRSWSTTSPREVTAGSGTMAGNTEFRYDETWVGDTLQSVTIRGHMSASQTGGGTAQADANYRTGAAGPHAAVTITGSLSFLASGTSVAIGSGGSHLRAGCGGDEPLELDAEGAAGSGEAPAFTQTTPVSVTLLGGEDECDIEVSLSAGTGTNQATTSDQNATADAEVQLTISFGPAPSPTPDVCTLKGQVSDTGGVERAGNTLAGVKVELLASLSNGGPSLAEPVATDAEGEFCFRLPAGSPSGDATLRATLVDFTHTPPLFETRHGADPDPVFAERVIHSTDAGRDDLDVNFVPTADRPWLADVATIHYQSQRFMDWIIEDLEIAPGLVGPVVMVTGAAATNHSALEHRIGISEADTLFAQRSDAASECPENCEWHELAHHVAAAVGIAPTATATECADRTPHGGWSNTSTCDSVAEGFASFLSTLGSIDIDANSGPGYATPEYSVFGSFEDNGRKAWLSWTSSTGAPRFGEDHAFAQLLWDLYDAGTGELELIGVEDDAAGANARDLSMEDRSRSAGSGSCTCSLARSRTRSSTCTTPSWPAPTCRRMPRSVTRTSPTRSSGT